MTEPKITGAWAVWHPQFEWGLAVPQLWASKELAISFLKGSSTWPLQHGWKLIRVQVNAVVSAVGESK